MQLLSDACVKNGEVDYGRFKRVAACGALAAWGGSMPSEPTIALPKLEVTTVHHRYWEAVPAWSAAWCVHGRAVVSCHVIMLSTA